jgi:ABC-2 type transport system permease protein
MIFLCGLFFPIMSLPIFIRPLSYVLPITYGVDILHGAVTGGHIMSFTLDFLVIGAFSIVLFLLSLYNIKRKWIS